jgi:hypothetical protein
VFGCSQGDGGDLRLEDRRRDLKTGTVPVLGRNRAKVGSFRELDEPLLRALFRTSKVPVKVLGLS